MTKRMAPFCGTIALLAQVFVFQGCGGSNNGNGGTGGSTTATGGVSGTGTGGTGTSTGGTTGTGGSASSTGGTTGAGGTAATGGATGTGGSGTVAACGNTTAGTAIGKGVSCTSADTQLCTKTCGPEKAGTKTEMCSGTAYTEGDCTFDNSKSYSCYTIPTTPDAMCPATQAMLQASQPCNIADCIVCGGTTGYLDSKGAAQTGYCVCQASATMPTWSCATTNAWPCPSSNGC